MLYIFSVLWFNLYIVTRYIIQLVKVLVAQSHPTLCNPMDCSPQGSSVHGILPARILEWVAIPFCRESSQPRDWTWTYLLGRQILHHLSHHLLSISGKSSRFHLSWWGVSYICCSRPPPRPSSFFSWTRATSWLVLLLPAPCLCPHPSTPALVCLTIHPPVHPPSSSLPSVSFVRYTLVRSYLCLSN